MSSLHREFVLDNSFRWIAAKAFIESNMEPMAESNSPLRLIITTQEEKRRSIQNAHYWRNVIGPIAAQAWIGGKQFASDVWHEQLARQFGVHIDVTLPNGDVVTKRLSTTEMSVKDFAHYVEEVTAWAAQELGIRFPSGRDE